MQSAGMTEVLQINTPALFERALQRSVALLRAGELVALPTETVYGLAANAFDPHAVARIFEVKGRPPGNPIIVHVASVDMARHCVQQWPAVADQLAAAFWPGPLTLVLPRSKAVPSIVTAGGSTVGVRWPSHPFIQAVIRACGFPLAAPSANPSSEVSATLAEHVRKSLGSKLRLVVDGGPTQVGLESTVLDISGPRPQLLRPGMIHAESLMAVTGALAEPAGRAAGPLRSPGLLTRHYSPRAKLVLWQWSNAQDLAEKLESQRIPTDRVHVLVHTHIPSDPKVGTIHRMPSEPAAYARGLYAELHACDAAGARLIVVEALPAAPAWRAIQDRLRRAAA